MQLLRDLQFQTEGMLVVPFTPEYAFAKRFSIMTVCTQTLTAPTIAASVPALPAHFVKKIGEARARASNPQKGNRPNECACGSESTPLNDDYLPSKYENCQLKS